MKKYNRVMKIITRNAKKQGLYGRLIERLSYLEKDGVIAWCNSVCPDLCFSDSNIENYIESSSLYNGNIPFN